MERLQQEPSEIFLYEDSSILTVEERTRVKWLLRLVGIWPVVGIGIAISLVLVGVQFWIIGLILGITVGMSIMTLLSWVVNQTCQIDLTTSTLTLTQKRLFGQVTVERSDIDKIEKIELTPKKTKKAWSYYITLKLRTEQSIAIDLTSSESVDRQIVRRIERFLCSRGDFKTQVNRGRQDIRA